MISTVIIIASGLIFQNGNYIAKECTGHGPNRTSATINALSNAVREANGVSISGEIKTNARIEHLVRGMESNFNSTEGIEEQLATSFCGYIKSYNVISELPDTESGYEITIRAEVEIFDPSNPRGGIIPTLAFSTFGGNDIFIEDLKVLKDACKSTILGSRRFDVLERERIEEILNENSRLKSSHYEEREKTKIGHLWGADYLASVRIKEFALKEDEEYVRSINTTTHYASLDFVANLTVWNTLTGKICFNKDYKQRIPRMRMDLLQAELDKLAILGHNNHQTINEIAGYFLANQMLDTIYPITIALFDSENGDIYLNQGSGRIHVGQIFEVKEGNEVIVDPITGSVLGKTKGQTALIKIVATEEKLSRAKLISGKITTITTGATCIPVRNP